MEKNKMFFYIRILSVVGLILSIYLLWQQFFKPDFQPCNINSWINCDAVISGPVAKTLGIPTPLFGFIGYLVIFFSAIFRKTKLMISMATFGLIFCLWIAYKELFELRVICPVCITCQIVMLSIFILSLKVNKHPKDKRV